MEKSSRWRLALASAIGTSHASTGSPCQDSAAHAVVPTNAGAVLVAVVSDGAGSAAHSEIGSWITTKTLIECVEVYLGRGANLADVTRDVALGWVEEIVLAIEAQAAAYDHRVRDYACTLLAAIAGEESAVFIQVGDGAMVVSHGEADGWSYVFWPQHGEFANTTNFVTAPNVAEVLELEVANRRIDEVAVFSDGIEKLVLHDASRTVHEAFFNRMFPAVRNLSEEGDDAKLSADLKAYLSSPVVCERTDDDKSLIMATRVPS